MSEESSKSQQMPMPRWLSRSEKARFRRIERLRIDGGRPILDAEVDAICDYLCSRSRIDHLRKMHRRAVREWQEDPDVPSAQNAVLAIGRQIDSASAAARRLGKSIGLGTGEVAK